MSVFGNLFQYTFMKNIPEKRTVQKKLYFHACRKPCTLPRTLQEVLLFHLPLNKYSRKWKSRFMNFLSNASMFYIYCCLFSPKSFEKVLKHGIVISSRFALKITFRQITGFYPFGFRSFKMST